MSNTICAIATAAAATAALGVIRVSGPEAFELVCPLLKTKKGTPVAPNPNHAAYCRIEKGGEVYDEAVATFYAGPRSYTGEDTVELSCHGGLYVLRSVLNLLLEQGCRMAEPGEFSKRAFLNGKLDLIKAQAVIDLIEATSRAEQKNALSQLGGHLSQQIGHLYDRLVELNLGLLAYVDFPDEVEDPEQDTLAELKSISAELDHLIQGGDRGSLIREGLQIAIVGAPNVGKSTLMNRLLGYDRSIVSDIPGTTRDLVSEGLQLGGLKCRVADTAGIRETADVIERQGVSIARREAEAAGLVFAVFDGSHPLTEDDQQLAKTYGNDRNLAIINKGDLEKSINDEYIKEHFKHIVYISAKDGQGCPALDEWVRAHYSVEDAQADGVITSARQLQRLLAGKQLVDQAIDGLAQGFTPDLVSLDITEAASALGEVTGQTVTDEMIDKIFERFCVGK